MAIVFGGFAIILRVLDGPESFRANGTSLTAFLAAYATSGLVGGVIVGLARPVLPSLLGSALVGLVIGVILGVMLNLINHDGLSGSALLSPITFGLCGCMSGLLARWKLRQLGKI
jgi:hypothetical protein